MLAAWRTSGLVYRDRGGQRLNTRREMVMVWPVWCIVVSLEVIPPASNLPQTDLPI